MEELLAHVKAENVKTQAWVAEDPANRWAGLYSEDAQDWIDRGITTLEQLRRDELEMFIYDACKSTLGYRPSYQALKAMTMAELEAEADRVGEACAREIEEQEARAVAAFIRFEKRIADIQEMMGNMKEDALRILIDAEGETEDVKFYGYESLEYSLGIKYGSIKKWLEM